MTTNQVKHRELLTKKPFYRINADVGKRESVLREETGETPIMNDTVKYEVVTQADFIRELDPNSHAINDRNI